MCFVITICQHFANKKCRSCLAVGPGRIRIVNTHYTQGISLHGFPSDEKDRKRRRQRNKLVIKALIKFRAICAFVLTCSTHFEETKNLRISAAVGLKRKIIYEKSWNLCCCRFDKKAFVLMLDVVLGCYRTAEFISLRDRRQVNNY